MAPPWFVLLLFSVFLLHGAHEQRCRRHPSMATGGTHQTLKETWGNIRLQDGKATSHRRHHHQQPAPALRGGITRLVRPFFCCCATGRKWHSEVLIEVYLGVFFLLLLLPPCCCAIKCRLNFIIKPTGFTVGKGKERVMTLQTRLFTGAASSSVGRTTTTKLCHLSRCQSL